MVLVLGLVVRIQSCVTFYTLVLELLHFRNSGGTLLLKREDIV